MPFAIEKSSWLIVGGCGTGCQQAAYEGLEPCVGKLTSTVLMGLEPSNRSSYQTFTGTRNVVIYDKNYH